MCSKCFFTSSAVAATLTIDFCARLLGPDLLVTVTGGQAHIGAVAIAQPRNSLEGSHKTSASASVITVTGHKEDMLARDVALRIASHFAVTTTVVCGIHMNSATQHDIESVYEATIRLTENFCNTPL